jgi:16S rRNA (adenine1518-N6/adenine1519-N6)-dimethyltransferase
MTENPTALPPAPPLRDLCIKYDIRFKKGLGQNLLLDDNINRIMVEAADLNKEDYAVEVGAGLGALTRRLCHQAGKVLSVEIDTSFIPCLEDQFGARDNFHLFRGDILNHELSDLLNEHIPGGKRYKMISNLPYYITTPIMFQFLESKISFERIVVMMQEEVAQRLVAEVGSENYSILTLATQSRAQIDIVHTVPASCFLPKPKVCSSIVRLRRYTEDPLPGVNRDFLLKVVRAAFQQRRKTIRNSLGKSSSFGVPQETVLDAMKTVDIDPSRRPQTLTLTEFATLSQEILERIA